MNSVGGSGSRGGPALSDGIDRHQWSVLGESRYVRDYVLPSKPVVISGGFDTWPARDKWTFDYFKDHYGDLPLKVDGRSLSMADLITEVCASTAERPAPYLHNHPVGQLPPELQADIEPMPACTRPNWLEHPLIKRRADVTFPEIYIGGAGAKFPVLHYDGLHTHAFLMQIQGVKEYIGFAPDQSPYMYVRGGSGQPNVSKINDVDRCDPDAFPLFGKAEGIRFTLHPGETLFMPAGWWHTARILSPSITVSINGANVANWTEFRKDLCQYYMVGRKVPPSIYAAYFFVVGKWIQLFAANGI